MRKPMLYAVRFLMIAALLVGLSVIAASPSGQRSPYASALTTITSPLALAQTCAMSSCGRDKEGQLICTGSSTATNCTANKSGHKCSTTNC